MGTVVVQPISTTLTPLTLVSPVFSSGATTLSIDSAVLPLEVVADLNTVAIDVLVGATAVSLTSPTVVNGKNVFTGQANILLQPIAQVFQLTGRNYNPLNPNDPNLATPKVTPTLQYEILYVTTQLAVSISPPSGVTIYKGSSTCRIEWALPSFAGFEGVRVQWSTDASGVTTPYQQYGALVSDVTRTGLVQVTNPTVLTASTPVANQAGFQSTVTTSTVLNQTIQYCSATIPLTTVGASLFYVQLTTVLQDAVTNAVYESIAAGPFTCGFVNLKVVSPTDFLALQRPNDIASRMIMEMTRREPLLDLTAHAEMRDLVINTVALELANLSVREWVSRCAQSISAIAQIDNASGNGVSDPFQSSTVKQSIARAYGLSATSCQSFIDNFFDILGEQAGILRGGATSATVSVTFYVYARPISLISLQEGILVSTVATATTQSAQFTTTGSSVIDPTNPSVCYDPTNNWWFATVPAQAVTAGSAGNAGAGSIRTVTSGGPSGVSVVNQTSAQGGSDQQSNADYAAMIQDRLVTGVDTGSRNGYTVLTLGIPGITDCQVVAAGDTDMLRDWSTTIDRHTYGCVDIYARGSQQSQQTELVPFTYQTPATYGQYTTYTVATLIDPVYLRFKLVGFSTALYTVVEMVVVSAGRTLWLGVQHAQIDNNQGQVFLDPTEYCYVVNLDGSTTPWQINGTTATNAQVISGVGTQASVVYYVMAREQTGFEHVPALQPVFAVDSLVGPLTGAIPEANIELVYTNDFLLTGGSNDAGDTVQVNPDQTVATQKSIVAGAVGAVVAIDSGMSLALNSNGAPLNVLSVRSSNSATLYTYGVDYLIVPTAPYHSYGLKVLATSSIATGATLLVGYNKFLLNEQITLQTDTLTLTGTTPAALSQAGFIENTWLPASYGNTTLLLDGYSDVPQDGLVGAGVAPASRYIKVTYQNNLTGTQVVADQGQDFLLVVTPDTGTATIERVAGSAIQDGASVQVTYFYAEVFTLTTEYPTYVEQAIALVNQAKHAAADVLVKAMVASPVDITMVVNLASNMTPEAIDGRIRTALSIALDNADTSIAQSVLVSQVQGLAGVTSVELPLLKCAKSDGAYVIGALITTGTPWLPLANDASFAGITCPTNSWITEEPVLENQTIPSGGEPNAYVGLLYEGQGFARCLTITQFLASSIPSFYIVGTDDEISPTLPLDSTYAGKILFIAPSTLTNPALWAFRVTYQCFGNAGTSDVSVASPEYLVVGNLNILYNASS